MKDKTCFFTGHRNLPYNELPQIKAYLKNEVIDLIENGVIYFGAGGAVGFDILASLVVLECRKKYPQIKLILVLPCRNQEKYWNQRDKEVYDVIKLQADKIVYTSEAYFHGCMQKRNRHLVNDSKYCICYLKNYKGGTAYTVNYAKQMDVVVRNLFNKTEESTK